MKIIKKILAFILSHKVISILIVLFLILICEVIIVPNKLIKKTGPYSFALYDSKGKLLGAQVASDDQWRFESGKVPEKFEKAIIAYEDKRFYFHPGVDFISIARAFVYNVKQNRIVSGGSTITMQTVRILEHNPRRTVVQKIHEAWVSVLLELRFSKKKILELYCGNAPFGGNVIGLEAASWRYFNRAPDDITWAEACTLAVLPNQPSLVYPGANSEILKDKRDALLYKLYKKGKIDRNTLSLSLEEELPGKPYPLPSYASHYLEKLKKENPKKTKFYSTLDYELQKNTQRRLEQWSKDFSRNGINNAAAIILENSTGNVLAYIGNTGFADGRNTDTWSVNVASSRRSSGSLLKPFLYCAMLDNGTLLGSQLVIDVPTRIGSYRPENNIPVFRGALPADEALTRSLNIPAIRELREYGINAFLTYLRQVGFTTFNRTSDEYGLPLILGGGEITLEEACYAYSKMMKKALNENSSYPGSVGACYLTLSALEEGIRPAEEANWQYYANSKRIAWKTGTSSGNRDAWAVGTTAEYTVGVWIGNAEGYGTPDLKSVTTSAPVLFDVFSSLPTTSWPVTPFSDLEYVEVCTNSGFLAGADCPEKKYALKAKAAPLGKLCPYCRTVSLTPDGKYQASVQDLIGEKAGKYNGLMPKIEKRFVLPPSIEYWYKKINIGYIGLPDFVPWNAKFYEDEISIVFPEEGANLIIPIELGGVQGSMVMQAASRYSSDVLYWDLDGDFIGSTDSIHELKIAPLVGKHVLTVTNSKGVSKIRNFEVVPIYE